MVKGVYAHVPFCRVKCPYCDFYSVTEGSKEAFTELLLKEARLRLKGVKAETLYLGGGTPSLLGLKLLARLLERLISLTGGPGEVTVEVNPEDFGPEAFKTLKSLGVTRVSVGVQSFTEEGLRALGRRHGVKEAVRAVEAALEAGLTVNADLIWGWEGQTEELLAREFKLLERLRPHHLSAYLLSPPAGSGLRRAGEEELVKLHALLSEKTRQLGYERYEVSNWARDGAYCRHNLLYWKLEPFVGLGPSAWSFVGNERFYNERSLSRWAEKLKRGEPPTAGRVKLDEVELEKERIMLGLRLREGLPESYRRYVPPFLEEFFERDRFAVKEEHLLLLNELTAHVLLEYDRYNIKSRRARSSAG
ncbi:MAG: radical SAM family heme chaperone HemW [Aquificae bacterium]|nr:radical SAM family heme chaperone HemW [Aquificota bacterium]